MWDLDTYSEQIDGENTIFGLFHAASLYALAKNTTFAKNSCCSVMAFRGFLDFVCCSVIGFGDFVTDTEETGSLLLRVLL